MFYPSQCHRNKVDVHVVLILTHISKCLVESLLFWLHQNLVMNPNISAGVMSEKPSRKLNSHCAVQGCCPSPVSITTSWGAWACCQSMATRQSSNFPMNRIKEILVASQDFCSCPTVMKPSAHVNRGHVVSDNTILLLFPLNAWAEAQRSTLPSKSKTLSQVSMGYFYPHRAELRWYPLFLC